MNEPEAPETPDVLVSIASDCPAEAVADLLDAADKVGLRVQFERREPELFAAIEWQIPTIIILFLCRKFVDTLLEEAAKDLYPGLKAAILRVVGRSSGPTRAINPTYVSSSPHKVPSGPVTVLTVLTLCSGNEAIQFRFPADLPENQHAAALRAIAQEMMRIDSELDGPDKVVVHRQMPAVYTFDTGEIRWKQVDIIAEMRAEAEEPKGDP